MSIYNSIYCFFYKLWEKRGIDGRFAGVLHLLFTLLMHFLLLIEIYEDITGKVLVKTPEFSANSDVNLIIIFAPLFLCIRYYFGTTRTNELLEKYDEKYGEDESKISLIILLFVIMPIILVLALSAMRHKGYF